MLSCPSGLHLSGLGHLFLRGPRFNTQSAWLSINFAFDIAVTSEPHDMPPQHLWDPTQRVHISGWPYRRRECPCGQSSNYPFKIGGLCEFLCVTTLSILSPLTAALDVVYLTLNFIFLHCVTLGSFGLSFYVTNKIGKWKARHQKEAARASRSRIQNEPIKSFISESCSNLLILQRDAERALWGVCFRFCVIKRLLS